MLGSIGRYHDIMGLPLHQYQQIVCTIETHQTTDPVVGKVYKTAVGTGNQNTVLIIGNVLDEMFRWPVVLTENIQQGQTQVTTCFWGNVKIPKVFSNGMVFVIVVECRRRCRRRRRRRVRR